MKESSGLLIKSSKKLQSEVISMMYVVSVAGGKELKARDELNKIKGMQAILPTNMVDIRKGGTWHEEEKILIPGYVFLECKYNTSMYYKVKNTYGVTKWLGGGNPTPLTADDEKFVEYFANGGKPIPVLTFDSPFVRKAIIKRVDKHRRRITATIRIFEKVHTITFGYRA